MTYDGFIDSTGGGLVRGWAFDPARADSPVEVELASSAGWAGTVLADEFRPDLKASGLGNGRHGFTFRLPPGAWRPGAPPTVTARIRGPGFELHGSPAPLGEFHLIELVAGDIVSNCNLRCPFCITDYENIRGLKQMPLSTFEKSLALLPLVPDGKFWLSCMHEPTLHAEFAAFLEAIPDAHRGKVSFTTNLCRKMDEGTLARVAHSGVHSIRVSLDSMDPVLFGQLRKGGRFELFIEQLRRIAELGRDSARPVPLHIITMAFKDNLAEIPDLVRRCHDEFGAAFHEVRFMYYAPHIAEWGEPHILSMEQWKTLRAGLLAEWPEIAFGDPPDDIHRQFRERPGAEHYEHTSAVFGRDATPENYRHADPLTTGFPVPDEDLRLRLRWDGLLMAEQLPEPEFRANILDLSDPAAYFHALRTAGAAAQGRAATGV